MDKPDSGDPITKEQKKKMDRIKGSLEGCFTVSVSYVLEDIENLHVHKGKDPVLEIEFPKNKIERFLFPCDNSRQEFIKKLIEIKNDNSS
jgi:hypothetical protein